MPAYGAVKHAKDFEINIDDSGGDARDVSGDCIEFSWPMAAAVAEAMGAQDSYEEYVAGLKGSKVSGTFHVNDAATTGSWTVCSAALGSTRTFAYMPFGNTSGYPKISAEVIVTGLTVDTNLTSAAQFSIEGVSTSTVSVGTVS